MTAIMNGVALHGGFIPYGATFLMFMEYARNAVRMSALMKQRVIYVFTHDSIGLGEDGPTHQPIEQLASLRSTPNLDTWRPCDAVESAVAWKYALERKDGPSGADFLPPEPAAPGARRRPDRRHRPRRLRAEGLRRRAGADPDRHRFGSRPGCAGLRQADRAGPQGARGFDAVAPACSTLRMLATSKPCCRCRSARVSRSKRLMPTSGSSTWVWKAA